MLPTLAVSWQASVVRGKETKNMYKYCYFVLWGYDWLLPRPNTMFKL